MKRTDARARERVALELRRSGASIEEIGRRLGMTKQRTSVVVRAAESRERVALEVATDETRLRAMSRGEFERVAAASLPGLSNRAVNALSNHIRPDVSVGDLLRPGARERLLRARNCGRKAVAHIDQRLRDLFGVGLGDWMRTNVVVAREGDWEDGFFVAQDRYVTGGLAVAVGDYSKGRNGETRTRLRVMSPETARRLAVELAAMADAVEDEIA